MSIAFDSRWSMLLSLVHSALAESSSSRQAHEISSRRSKGRRSRGGAESWHGGLVEQSDVLWDMMHSVDMMHFVGQVRDTELVAVACDDMVVRLYDVATRKLVRRLAGHSNHLTDMAFTPDFRRLVTSSMDHTLR